MSAIATTARDEVLIARNPATGLELGRVPATPPEHVGDLVKRAAMRTGIVGFGRMAGAPSVLKSWWKILSRDADRWADLVRSEIGKPRIEAMGGEVLSSLDAIRWTVRRGGATLADRQIGPAWQRWLTMSGCRCRWVPLGVIGMLGTWNYPLFLNAPPIAQALAAGNAVVWKASELAPLCGALLEEGLKEAGFPEGLVAIIQGGPDVGRALVDSDLDKGMFTGGVENGRRVLATLAGRGIPAVAELSGFDPAIVLADAPMESTVKALTWAAFVGCGQTCVAVKRIFVVGDPTPWADALATSARALRVGDPESPGVNVGPMISANARERFHAMVRASTDARRIRARRRRTDRRSREFLPPHCHPRRLSRLRGCTRRSLRTGRRHPGSARSPVGRRGRESKPVCPRRERLGPRPSTGSRAGQHDPCRDGHDQ